ncbi:MAG: SusC/RagA family TonB-linked outer membrane protein [Haliscomenobacter sp.]|nr:SusC/RagA family TonB-linked outer membrane protein [Haliscomenobacter sp.]
MKKHLLASVLVMFSFVAAMAQRTITGTVSDEAGEPLIGASILVKGTSTGAVTDLDGTYSINVPGGEVTLIFSYTGYITKEVITSASNVIDMTLEESAEQLSEVLVTAIGIERSTKAMGYAVTNLAGDDLLQKSEVDPVRAVAGKVPGVSISGAGGGPGQSTKINIRGFSSLTGNTQPLFVVDGVPFDNSTNATRDAASGNQTSSRAFDIDPNNIESMTILKGAAAAALYGSRATNGVVVITTKTGTRSARKGLEVTYNSSFQLEQISGVPEYQNVYGQGSNQVYNGGFIGNWGSPFAEHVDRLNATYGTNYSKVITPGYPEGTVPHPLVSGGFAGSRFPSVFPELMEPTPGNPSVLRAIPVPYRAYDIVEPFFQDGQLFENSLNISAGGPEASINAVVSRMNNEGIVPNSEAGRTSLSFGGNAKLSNGLLLNGNVTYVNTTQATPPTAGSIFGGNSFSTSDGSIFTRLFFLPRNFDLMETNPEGIPYPFENPTTGDNVFYRALDDPRWLTKYNRYSSNVNRVYGNMTLSYDVLPWLNFMARGGINTYSDGQKSIERPGGVADADGEIWTNDITNSEIDLNYLATITKDISEDIDFRLIGGFNWNQRERRSRYVVGDQVITSTLLNTDATAVQLSNETNTKQRFYAAYGDLQLGYKDYLYLGITARNDWSSTLPAANRSFFYPGVNASFVLTDALGLTSNLLGFAKIRAAWTQVGNEAPAYSTTTPYFLSAPFTTAGGSIFNRATLGNRLGNAILVNELTTELEFGADLRFLRNRIGLDFTWFKRNSTDQITATDVPGSSGFNSAVVNAGEVENKGIEVSLNLVPVKLANGFEWNTTVNFTRIRSLIVDAGEGGDIVIGGLTDGGGGVIHRTGNPYGQLFGTKIARTPEGDILIDKTLGKILSLPSLEVIGDPNPDFLLGLINEFNFKGFSLNALIDWRQGGDMYLTTAGALLLRGQLPQTEDREPLRVIPGVYGSPQTFEAVTDENGNYIRNTTAISAFDYHFSDGFGVYGPDETNVYDVTTVRLREVSLAYSFPKKLLAKTPFGSARISVSGRNLWWRTPNILAGVNQDPEVLAEGANSNVQGIEYGGYPTTRRYGVNLSVSF